MAKDKPIIELKNVSKVYHMGDVEVKALNKLSLTVEKGSFTVPAYALSISSFFTSI